MGCSSPGFPVLHYLPEIAQNHVHWVDDAIQLSHALSSPSPPAFSLSQLQGLFQWVGSSHQVAKGLACQLQRQSFQWIFRVDFLWDWLVWSPCSPRDSPESSPAPQFNVLNFVLSLFKFFIKVTYINAGKPCMLPSIGLQRVGHNLATEQQCI